MNHNPNADLLVAPAAAPDGTPQASRLDAALLDAARALRAERDRASEASDELIAMRLRADALLARAQAAARAGDAYLAFDCVQQIERELVLATTAEERAARVPALVLEARARLEPWRAAVADRLADAAHGGAPTVATLQALLANLHAAAQERLYQRLLAERQVPVVVGVAAATTVLYLGWSLIGGFDWLTNDNYEITTAMWFITGALFGLFGAVLSMLFGLFRGAHGGVLPDLRHLRLITFARPLVGLLSALPIVLLLETGVLNFVETTPALVFGLCFAAGFAERWFVARLLRREPDRG